MARRTVTFVVLSIVAVALWIIAVQQSRRGENVTFRENGTRSIFNHVEQQLIALANKGPIPATSVSRMMAIETYTTSNLNRRGGWGTLSLKGCDAWGNPLQIQKLGERQFVVWSFGPNERDDEQKGDDIVRTISIDGGDMPFIRERSGPYP